MVCRQTWLLGSPAAFVPRVHPFRSQKAKFECKRNRKRALQKTQMAPANPVRSSCCKWSTWHFDVLNCSNRSIQGLMKHFNVYSKHGLCGFYSLDADFCMNSARPIGEKVHPHLLSSASILSSCLCSFRLASALLELSTWQNGSAHSES